MSKIDNYHFHKDCKYYPQCTETPVRDGRHECIRFYCPAMNENQMYYKNDLHTIKWECGRFEPYQENLFGKD